MILMFNERMKNLELKYLNKYLEILMTVFKFLNLSKNIVCHFKSKFGDNWNEHKFWFVKQMNHILNYVYLQRLDY